MTAIVKNEYGKFVVETKRTASGVRYTVNGTGLERPQIFRRYSMAMGFAQDQLLIVTLESEMAN